MTDYETATLAFQVTRIEISRAGLEISRPSGKRYRRLRK